MTAWNASHIILEGQLADAPGRHDHWTETVSGLGEGRYLLESTVIDSTTSAESWSDEHTIDSLINWIHRMADAEEDRLDEESLLRSRLQQLADAARIESDEGLLKRIQAELEELDLQKAELNMEQQD